MIFGYYITNFALTAVKEIDVTDDYMGMSEDVTKCQDRIRLEDCETKEYFEYVLKKCNCIPFKLGHNFKVYCLFKLEFFTACFYSKGPLCDEFGRLCISTIGPINSFCLTPCRGIYADVKRTPFVDTGFFMNTLHDDYAHYKRFQEKEVEFPAGLKGCFN